jgi:hypothetical protein
MSTGPRSTSTRGVGDRPASGSPEVKMLVTSFTELVGCAAPVHLAGPGVGDVELATAVARAGGSGDHQRGVPRRVGARREGARRDRRCRRWSAGGEHPQRRSGTVRFPAPVVVGRERVPPTRPSNHPRHHGLSAVRLRRRSRRSGVPNLASRRFSARRRTGEAGRRTAVPGTPRRPRVPPRRRRSSSRQRVAL